MKRLLATLVVAILAGALAAAPAAGATAGPTAAPDGLIIEQVDTSGHPEVSVTVSLPGELVGSALDSGAFGVTEDGVPRTAGAERLANDDLYVVLALDVSGSMTGAAIEAAKEAAAGFLEAMPDGVQVALVTFAADAALAIPFSTDVAIATAEIARLDPSGETALYDGIALAAAEFPTTESGRRIVVLLSDGGDTTSSTTLAEAETTLRHAGIGLHAVELESADNDPAALRSLADAADGTVVAATDPEGLTGVFASVASQIVNRYRVTYQSEARDTAEVAVEVRRGDASAAATSTISLPASPPPPSSTAPPTTMAAPANPPPATRQGVPVTVPWYRSVLALQLGAAAVFLALAGLLLSTGMGRRRRIDLTPQVAGEMFGPSGGRTLSRLAGHATSFAEKSLRSGGRMDGLSRRLEEAGLAMRPAELAVLHLIIAVTTAALFGLLLGPVAAVAGAVLGLVVVVGWLKQRGDKRQAAFALQLPDVLQLMAGGLRAGYGLMQSLDSVALSMPAPAGTEFRRAKTEVHLGKETETALRDMATRLRSDDFRWVVDAIEIHRQVGGDLGEILDAVGDTIRDRQKVKRRIKGLAAEGRVSAIILCVLPFVVAGAVALLNPGYFNDLTGTAIGRFMIGGSGLLMLLGIIWMNRITALKF